MNSSVFENMLGRTFVNKCARCGKPSETALCASCAQKVRPLGNTCCKKCGKPYYSCICKKQTVPYERCVSAMEYENPVAASLVYKLKEKGDTISATFLATMAAQKISQELGEISFDAVTFVPVSFVKIAVNGYDHAELLARRIARLVGAKLVKPPLRRISFVKQKYLGAIERSRNADSLFKYNGGKISGCVLLVDDVMTTGATLAACSKILKKAGAAEVYCVTAVTALKK